MQQRRNLSQPHTTKVLLNGQLNVPKWWAPTVSLLGIAVLIGFTAIGIMVKEKIALIDVGKIIKIQISLLNA